MSRNCSQLPVLKSFYRVLSASFKCKATTSSDKMLSALRIHYRALRKKSPFISQLPFRSFHHPVSEALHVQSRVKPGNGPRFAVRFFPQEQSYPLFCTTICHFHYIYAVSQKKGTLLCCHNLYSKYVIEHTTVLTFYVSFCGLPIA